MLPRRAPSPGLTLVELMIGIALSAVLLALAVPSFQAQIAGSQLTSASEALMGSLMQARAQAIRLGRRVTVCRSADLQQCDDDTSRGWETGWLTFIDMDRATAPNKAELSATDTLLARSDPLPSSLRAWGNSAVSQYISFAPNGEARSLSGGSNPLGTLQVCSTSAALADARRATDLVLSAGGRVVSRQAGNVTPQCPRP